MKHIEAVFCQPLLNSVSDGIYFVDNERRITFWNKGAEIITGFTAQEVLGRPCSDNILNHVNEQGVQLCLHDCPLSHAMADGQPREADVYLLHKQGYRLPVHIVAQPIYANKSVVGAWEVFHSHSALPLLAKRVRQLQQLSMIDPLTQIANRRFLETLIGERLALLKRYTLPFGLLYLDLDDFKAINDTYGHETGDRVLKIATHTLASNIRLMDRVGRWGGEEFIIILPRLDYQALCASAERLRVLVEHSHIHVDGQPVGVTVSGGATLAMATDTVASIVDRADRLMYAGKQAGKNRITCG